MRIDGGLQERKNAAQNDPLQLSFLIWIVEAMEEQFRRDFQSSAKDLFARLLLSRAKHQSLQGHPRMALRIARLVPAYNFSEDLFFASDSAPLDIQKKASRGIRIAWSISFGSASPKTIAMSADLESGISDLAFVNAHRVPFQYQRYRAGASAGSDRSSKRRTALASGTSTETGPMTSAARMA